MPRKSKKLAEPSSTATPVADIARPDQTETAAPASGPAGDERNARGQFLKNNAGGPGNPHARHCARMLEMFRNSITDDEMFALCRVLFERAITGDMNALKMIFQYKLGKPLPAPNPDMIDRDEWDHFQKDAMTLDEMKKVLGQLPSRIGNAIVSAALPSIASTISHTLAQQLLQGLPAELLGNQSNGPTINEPNPAAVSNGLLPAQPSSESSSPAPRHTPLVTHSDPISNGFLPALDADGLPARPLHHVSSSSKPSRDLTAQANEQVPVSSSLSTRHTPLTTRSTPISNGKSKTAPKGKKRRNSIGKQWLAPIAKKCKSPTENRKQRVSA
jgi:hypothetical protein